MDTENDAVVTKEPVPQQTADMPAIEKQNDNNKETIPTTETEPSIRIKDEDRNQPETIREQTENVESGSANSVSDKHTNTEIGSQEIKCTAEVDKNELKPEIITEELVENELSVNDAITCVPENEHAASNMDMEPERPVLISVIKDDKVCDSDANSVDTNNEEQHDINVNSNSQFYGSSDSKVDYAIKDDDNDTLSDVDDIKTDSASADSEDSALGSLPSDSALNEREEEAQDRGDGSDSGLGSETTDDIKLVSSVFALELPSSSSQIIEDIGEECQIDSSDPLEIIEPKSESLTNIDSHTTEIAKSPETSSESNKPLRSSLKRKIKEVDDKVEEPKAKKRKDGIRFDNVTVYYFPRAQGFTCVPSQGGSTLGMEWNHSHMHMFTLAEHAVEQRRLHRQILQQLKNERHSLQGASLSSSDDSDTEEDASDISESELDLDSYYFLQPVPTRQRRALLRAAGVRKIEGYEKDQCRDIRTSREFCGCACKGTCKPETCSCSLAGIKCQVDRLNFPCGCTRDGCTNPTGRIEFNPIRVRTHFIHTLMRIGMEKKHEESQAASKRSWAQLSTQQTPQVNTPVIAPNNQYDKIQTPEGLVRDVNLTPRVEVEACVNGGNFSNVHCMNATESVLQPNVQDTINFRYPNESINHGTIMHVDKSSNLRNQTGHYASSMMQGKGPPYSMPNNAGFESVTHNAHRFPCDLNYYGQHDNNQFKNLQSFPASSFEEFAHAHNSHMTVFNNYNNVYSAEYMHKQNSNAHHSEMQYHEMAPNHYDMYKSSPAIAESTPEPYYAPLMSMPYHASNKLENVCSDENWFSNSTLVGLEHSEQTQDAPEPAAPVAEPLTTSEDTEPTENFGELIKKTMVESVSV